MRGAIDLLGKTIEFEETQYNITNINFVPNLNSFYVELENEQGLLNMSLKDLTRCLNEQINLKNGNGRKKCINS
jgi:hypothetical protein